MSKQLHPKEEISTFYIGGGTPAFDLNERQLEKLLNGIHDTYSLYRDGAEFTMEANPESVSFEKLKIMRDYGVNRLSMGDCPSITTS